MFKITANASAPVKVQRVSRTTDNSARNSKIGRAYRKSNPGNPCELVDASALRCAISGCTGRALGRRAQVARTYIAWNDQIDLVNPLDAALGESYFIRKASGERSIGSPHTPPKDKQMTIDNLRRRALVGFAAVAVGLVAGASLSAAASAAENLPAAARVDVALQPNRTGRGHVKMYRDLNYGLVQDKLTYARGGPPDYCDLPSAGCESYLSN